MEKEGRGRGESKGTHVPMSTSALGVSQLNWSSPLNDWHPRREFLTAPAEAGEDTFSYYHLKIT